MVVATPPPSVRRVQAMGLQWEEGSSGWTKTQVRGLLRLPAADGEGHVVPAEAEGVGERDIHPALDFAVRCGVEIALGAGSKLIDGGGDDPAGGRQQRHDELERAGPA